MIVRTYGRRNRGELSRRSYSEDTLETEDDDLYGISLPHSQNDALIPSSSRDAFLPSAAFPFSSQESSCFDTDSAPSYSIPRSEKQSKRPRFSYSTTLMEAQEFGEMMENVDEVHFALDGLRMPQPIRIRRASLLSLLSICGTQQQRRLLRTQGLAKTIMDAFLCLGFDDAPCNLAAAALFYLLTGDGQDDHLLESPENMKFLLRLLKPNASGIPGGKTRNVGSKLVAISKEVDGFKDSAKLLEDSSEAIADKVKELLVNCKDLKAARHSYKAFGSTESCAKWIALLTMEKACLSKISFEDLSGSIREIGGNFKDKLRELGGLDAVFEVVKDCYSDMENFSEKCFPAGNKRVETRFKGLELLLKCLKIMENATFLSESNQLHLLSLKAKSDNHGRRSSSFTEILINFIKILSGLCLRKDSNNEHHSAFDLAYPTDYEDGVQEIVLISSSEDCCSAETSSIERVIASQKSSTSSQPRDGARSSAFSSINDLLRNFSCEHASTSKPNKNNDGEDPFAFDEDDIQPSMWDSLHASKSRDRTVKFGEMPPSPVINMKNSKVSEQASDSVDEEYFELLFNCIHSAVKVLMNLTNENPIGCKQIGSYGGLEIMSSLIFGHFPTFTSLTPSVLKSKPDEQNDYHLSDHELDFLVAILGLLVNLVEKDGTNRSRLAAVTVPLSGPGESPNKTSKNVIPLLCSIFLINQGAGDSSRDGNTLPWNDEAAVLQGEKEAEKMIVEAYSALLLAFLSTESKLIRESIANCLPNNNLAILVPVLERFLAFHKTLNMISAETHEVVKEVIESCRLL